MGPDEFYIFQFRSVAHKSALCTQLQEPLSKSCTVYVSECVCVCVCVCVALRGTPMKTHKHSDGHKSVYVQQATVCVYEYEAPS